MRIVVIGGFEAPSPYAHALNTVKMADAFAALGHQVTLVCRRAPGVRLALSELAAQSGATHAMQWRLLPARLCGRDLGSHWKFALLALPIILMQRPALVFARNYITPYVTARLGVPTIAESHAHPGTEKTMPPFAKMIEATKFPAFRKLITISPVLRDYYIGLGVPGEKIQILADAVDLSVFSRPAVLPASPYDGRPAAVYAGHLYDYKGIPTILDAAQMLPEVVFHLVGGLPADLARQRDTVRARGLANVILHGMMPHAEVPPYLWHADVLLLPPSAKHPSAAWTSPMKLGEYLASGSPVVATAIPALRHWLTDHEVHFVAPDDPAALASGVRAVLADKAYANRLRAGGSERALEFSFEQRAQAVLAPAITERRPI